MRLLTIVEEDFSNYKLPSMLIGTISCGGKCCIEAGIPLSVCHNDGWRNATPIMVDDDDLCLKFFSNPITTAIVFGGLEPFEQFDEMYQFIRKLRIDYGCQNDVVIYTGFYEDEIEPYINQLKAFDNIIVKFGRYIPDQESHFDEVLGVKLASPNQYAKRIS